MKNIPDVFPQQCQHSELIYGGMNLRDYFAAKAMQGLLKSAYVDDSKGGLDAFAKRSYEIADAMLKQREL